MASAGQISFNFLFVFLMSDLVFLLLLSFAFFYRNKHAKSRKHYIVFLCSFRYWWCRHAKLLFLQGPLKPNKESQDEYRCPHQEVDDTPLIQCVIHVCMWFVLIIADCKILYQKISQHLARQCIDVQFHHRRSWHGLFQLQHF